MRHEAVQEQLSAYLEGDLSTRQRARVETHLAECAGCAAELRGLRRTLEMLRALPAPEPSPYLADAVIARVRAEAVAPGRLARLRMRVVEALAAPWLAPLAAGALAVALVFAWGGSQIGRGDAPASVAIVAEAAAPEARAREASASVATERAPASFAANPPGSRRSGRGPALLASTAPPGAGVREPLPPLASCLGTEGSPTFAAGSSEHDLCARWYSWMVGLARQDASAFIHELGRLPASERAEVLAVLSEFAMRSGSAPLLAPELRAAPDPRAGAIAIHFERPLPSTR